MIPASNTGRLFEKAELETLNLRKTGVGIERRGHQTREWQQERTLTYQKDAWALCADIPFETFFSSKG
jgi:hypothetical protein